MHIQITEDMQEILDEFIQEAEEILENLDQELIELENDPTNKELLNQIFRGMHTLKGGAGFLGLESIINLAHIIESIFDKLRNDELQLNSDMMDTILEGIDIIKNSIETLKTQNEIPDTQDIQSILDKLNDILKGKEITSTQEKTVKDAAPQTQEETTQSHNEDQEASVAQIDKEIEIVFHEDVDPDIQKLILQYPDKSMIEILDELILLPPEERDMDLIAKLDELIQQGKDVEDLIAQKIVKEKKELEEKTIEEKCEVVEAPQEEKKQKAPAPSPKAPVKKAKKEEGETIRIDIERVSTLMNLVGELVLDRNRIVKLTSRLNTTQDDTEVIEELSEAIAGMSRSVSDLQEVVMKLRMQPVKRIFSKFPRIVRDLAKKVGKKINLELEGEDTEIDRSILNQLEDPLIHLVRNSIDHGIEPPEERIAKGKPEYGTILLSALQEGDRIIVSIEDDGRGIDPDKIKQKAIEKGLIRPEQAEQMSDKEAFELIFMPGFSTVEKVSDLSGRGVGMDVVANVIHSLRGAIEVESEKDEGTKITMKLPLTVAIIRTLMVGVNNRIFAIPLFSVVEIIKYRPEDIKDVGIYKSLMLRDEVYLFFHLNELFDIESSSENKFVIIINIGEKNIAIAVDNLYGEEEIVIKPLGEMLKDVEGIAGATITGDGKVVLILDIKSLINDKRNDLIGVI
ncbi:two-component system, chemotaxis family, sensor kinase CheA [Nitratiruptor sp. YY08-26]|uniref:chemotaxis protein CheA n=1 Tax=unclassified Nitratiruptor TaxID=2624044 RepID=UPI0019158D5F|nr:MULTISPECIES: chemotaxis protein CheA [unclassified Nitratiruptor]BCD61843.1 two-component system, chemotaxis family, sensor kinase CheA [Nitratiruptor sp. YY08-13]BCD65778.1 two-component system, chemotaxis family, sensor kinase CheA [Nitratiruptor sp. YY08-26]